MLLKTFPFLSLLLPEDVHFEHSAGGESLDDVFRHLEAQHVSLSACDAGTLPKYFLFS